MVLFSVDGFAPQRKSVSLSLELEDRIIEDNEKRMHLFKNPLTR